MPFKIYKLKGHRSSLWWRLIKLKGNLRDIDQGIRTIKWGWYFAHPRYNWQWCNDNDELFWKFKRSQVLWMTLLSLSSLVISKREMKSTMSSSKEWWVLAVFILFVLQKKNTIEFLFFTSQISPCVCKLRIPNSPKGFQLQLLVGGSKKPTQFRLTFDTGSWHPCISD